MLVRKLKQIKVPNSIINWVINFISDRSQRVKLSKDCFLSGVKYHLECPRGPSFSTGFSSSSSMTCLSLAFSTRGNTLTIPRHRRLYPKVSRARLKIWSGPNTRLVEDKSVWHKNVTRRRNSTSVSVVNVLCSQGHVLTEILSSQFSAQSYLTTFRNSRKKHLENTTSFFNWNVRRFLLTIS